MKTIKPHLVKTLLGGALMALFMISYSCTQESVLNSEETLTAVNAKADKGEKVERPWKIRSSGTFAFDPTLDCGGLPAFRIVGGGEASHLGRYAVEIKWCAPLSPIQEITGTLTAANGDEIYFRSLLFTPEEGRVDYEVTGGSGRFDGADGAFTLFDISFVLDDSGISGSYDNAGGGYLIY